MAAALCYMVSITGSGCAQIGMPTGGPRDTIPPVLINANPPNKTLRFEGKRIVFTFDEYVHLQDVQKQLVVSPVPNIIPNITSKLKTVTITMRDTLKPNTTYSFQFGNSIQDIDENNPIHNFTYVFSTGTHIDSLTFEGKVEMAETGRADSTLIVMLYNNLGDSAVYKQKPRYIATLDSLGRFKFRYLAEGTYNVFALGDEGGQKMYNNPSETFAFADSPVHINANVKPLDLFAYAQEKNVKPVSTSTANNKKNPEKLLKFTSSAESQSQDLLLPLTLTFTVPLRHFDSAKIRLTDTLFQPKPASIYIDSTDKVITVKTAWSEDSYYRLLIAKDFAVDTLHDTLAKADTLKFKTKKESEYGSIKLNFKNLDKIRHPVLQFVQNNLVVDSFKLTSGTFLQKLFAPGDYELRILNDENDNGKWDPGNYHDRKQPEKVIYIHKKINIRSDWDNEYDLIL